MARVKFTHSSALPVESDRLKTRTISEEGDARSLKLINGSLSRSVQEWTGAALKDSAASDDQRHFVDNSLISLFVCPIIVVVTTPRYRILPYRRDRCLMLIGHGPLPVRPVAFRQRHGLVGKQLKKHTAAPPSSLQELAWRPDEAVRRDRQIRYSATVTGKDDDSWMPS